MAISLCALSTMAMLDLAAAASQAWLPMLVGTYTDTDSKGIYQYRFNQESGTAELTAVTPARNPSFVIFSDNGDNVYAVDESDTDDDALAAFRYEAHRQAIDPHQHRGDGRQSAVQHLPDKKSDLHRQLYGRKHHGVQTCRRRKHQESQQGDDVFAHRQSSRQNKAAVSPSPLRHRRPLRMARIRLRPRQRLHLLAQAQRRMRRAGSGQHPICSSRLRTTPPHV